MSCKHWLIENRLCSRNGCICIAHLRCNDHTAFDDNIRFCTKEYRIPENEVCEFTFFHRAHILGNTVCDCRIDGIFGDITFYTEVVIVMSCIFRKCTSLIFHLTCCLPGTCDNLTYTSHSLRVRAHHTEDTHIMKNILCCDCLRTDSGICKCNIFRNSLVKVMADHQHIQMLIQSVYCIWHCRVCGGWQYVRSCCCADDIRCMSTACTLCMISMDGSAADSCKCIFHTSTFI